MLELALRYWPEVVGGLIAAALLWWAASSAYDWAFTNGVNSERVRTEKVIREFMEAERVAMERAREAEQKVSRLQAQAGDDADERERRIHEDYERRIAGLDADRDRLREHWRSCATDRLSAGAAAAGAVAEADRLRRAGSARIVRATELAQSERDECIALYEALVTK